MSDENNTVEISLAGMKRYLARDENGDLVHSDDGETWEKVPDQQMEESK